ncbi:DUF418 domain-containing protein [Microbacterium yannicii]|uniref:DUF418 domain-containing protein n=1 Tax=Microbacterium yannicii TaxID=671622 RepID=UPI0002EB1C58|nr:DUF418 domain-containing protein [Microbacterium yannicii]
MSALASTAPASAYGSRALAPDLSRGMMLLFIALANVSWFLYGTPTTGMNAHPVGAEGADAIWQAIAIVAIDARSYPLFAFLFGYGIWQLYARQQARGLEARSARRLLQRRHLWLIVFGAVNAALLWYGDVLGAWGLLGLLVTWIFLRRKDRTLVVWASVLLAILAIIALLSVVGGLLTPPGVGGMDDFSIPNPSAISDYLASIGPRLMFWLILTPGQAILLLAAPIVVLIAIVCARHGILESPAAHRRLLVGTALIGITVGWVGAVPELLAHFGVWSIPAWALTSLHGMTGLFAALGYVAVFALIASRYGGARRPGRVVRSLTALGKRSLSGYLWQSVVFAPVLCAWGLGLGGILQQWQAALIALVTWLISLALMMVLDRKGVRGPAEWLLRKLIYRSSGATAATPVTYTAG